MAEDAIVAQYIVKTDAAVAQLNALTAKVAGIETAGKKSAKGTEDAFTKMGDNITNQFKQIGAGIAGAFAVDRLLTFGKEAVLLAAKVEGIEQGFSRLNNPLLLGDLRKATKGTVSDMELMRFAVQSNNFKIPLENLAKYLQFAGQRARQSGVSMEYLMDSMQTAIGRGSIETWDNLGFSIGKVREYLNGASIETISVGERAVIMEKLVTGALGEMGDEADNTAIRIAKLTAQLDNAIAAFGDMVIAAAESTGVFGPDTRGLEVITKASIDYADQTGYAANQAYEQFKELNDLIALTGDSETYRSRISEQLLKAEAELVGRVSKERKDADELALYFAKQKVDGAVGFRILERSAAKENLAAVEKDIVANITRAGVLQTQIKLYKEFLNPQKAATEATGVEIRNVAYYTEKLKLLKQEHDAVGTSVARVYEINAKMIPLQEELNRLNGKTKDSAADLTDNLENIGIKVKGLAEELEKLPVFTQQWIDKFNELEKSNVRLQAAKNLVANLKEDIEKPVEFQITPTETEKDVWADYYAYTQGLTKDNEAQMKAIRDARLADALAALDAEKSAEEERIALIFAGYQSAQMVADTFFSYIERARQHDLSELDRSLANGEITQKQYDSRKKQLMIQAAEDEKAARIFSAIINVATAVTTAMMAGPVSGQVLAAVTAALGAVQIGLIAAEPIPTFAKGVIGLKGPGSETSDSINARLSRGESVMTAKETREHRDVLEAIRNNRFNDMYVHRHDLELAQSGWSGLAQSISLNAGFNDTNLLRAIDRHRDNEVKQLCEIVTLLRGQRGSKRGGYA